MFAQDAAAASFKREKAFSESFCHWCQTKEHATSVRMRREIPVQELLIANEQLLLTNEKLSGCKLHCPVCIPRPLASYCLETLNPDVTQLAEDSP